MDIPKNNTALAPTSISLLLAFFLAASWNSLLLLLLLLAWFVGLDNSRCLDNFFWRKGLGRCRPLKYLEEEAMVVVFVLVVAEADHDVVEVREKHLC